MREKFNRQMKHGRSIALALTVWLNGCAGAREQLAMARLGPNPTAADTAKAEPIAMSNRADAEQTVALKRPPRKEIQTVQFEARKDGSRENEIKNQKNEPPPDDTENLDDEPTRLALDTVVQSVYSNFPLLVAARFQRNVANGEILSATGNFDTKLKAASENGPVGFYETYRQTVGATQPLYNGAELFGGYRIGKGNFQPWYLERQTNGSGEFKGGVQVPFARNVEIDSRRAELWKANFARQRTEPEIQAQLIDFVRDASLQYWDWVAAGQKQRIAERLLELATDRNDGIRKRVAVGDLDPPDADDNQRIIVSREAKAIDANRKTRQSAAKLSLYYRNSDGRPLIPVSQSLPRYPQPLAIDEGDMSADISRALGQRPEIRVINFLRREIDVDYASARNDLLPQVDGVLVGSQDIGTPTSKKNDKGPFELEAGLYAEVPWQRRKARGKMSALEAKVSQIIAKQRILEDKITIEIQSAYAALSGAWQRVGKAREAVRLARYMAEVEQKKFGAGGSDLLQVNLREQQAAEAAETEVDALLDYFQARAIYRAAMAEDSDNGF